MDPNRQAWLIKQGTECWSAFGEMLASSGQGFAENLLTYLYIALRQITSEFPPRQLSSLNLCCSSYDILKDDNKRLLVKRTIDTKTGQMTKEARLQMTRALKISLLHDS